MLLKRNHVNITIFGDQESSNINKILKSRMGFSVPPPFRTLNTTLVTLQKRESPDSDKPTISHAHSLSHVYTAAKSKCLKPNFPAINKVGNVGIFVLL